ncbi:MAG: hypothetical protein H6922_02360 [Pseudomonadaceae bacterium]|nr:hypothetical protein [Pseudomonadaceae bacterium]
MIRDKVTALQFMSAKPVVVVGGMPLAARVYGLLSQAGVRVLAAKTYDERVSASVVVEATGGLAPAFDTAMRALAAGVPCVSASELLVGVHGAALANAAAGQGTGFYFGAALGPLQPLAGWLAEGQVRRVALAVPDAPNMVLSRMLARGEDADTARARLEVEGFDMGDAGGKQAVLRGLAVQHAMGCRMVPREAVRQGVEMVDAAFLAGLRRFGASPVHGVVLADGMVRAGVMAVPAGHVLEHGFMRQVVEIESGFGTQTLQAEVVEEEATAQAVVADVRRALAARRHGVMGAASAWAQARPVLWWVQVPYAERGAVLEQATLLEDNMLGDGSWSAVVKAERAPQGCVAVPYMAEDVAGVTLRLVG